MINGATCNGTDHSGCGHLAATAKVGLDPFGAAVNDRTHTVYVTNNADGDSPGTVSVINGATCNGTHTTGCHRHFPTAATGILTAAHHRRHPHRHPLRHRLLQRLGDHPERITLQRRGHQRLPHSHARAGGRLRAIRRLPSTRAPAPSTCQRLPARIPVNLQTTRR